MPQIGTSILFVFGILAMDLKWAAAKNDKCNAGEEMRVGFLRYKCSSKGHRITPIGCVTDGGLNVDIGQTTSTEWFVFSCDMLSENVAQMNPIKCMLFGNELNPGDKMVYDEFYYQCTKTKSGLVLDVIGCTDSSGQLVEIGKTFDRKDFVFECSMDSGKAYERGVACKLQGIEIPVRKKFRDSDFAYHCKRKDEYGIELESIGCLGEESKVISVGDEFSSNGFRYRCEKENSDKGPVLARSIVGCVDTLVDGKEKVHAFGDTWEMALENPKYKYILQCNGNKDGAEQIPIRCGIDKDGKTLEANVGCVVKYSETDAFLCKEDKTGFFEMRLLKYNKNVRLSDVAAKYGVNAC